MPVSRVDILQFKQQLQALDIPEEQKLQAAQNFWMQHMATPEFEETYDNATKAAAWQRFKDDVLPPQQPSIFERAAEFMRPNGPTNPPTEGGYDPITATPMTLTPQESRERLAETLQQSSNERERWQAALDANPAGATNVDQINRFTRDMTESFNRGVQGISDSFRTAGNVVTGNARNQPVPEPLPGAPSFEGMGVGEKLSDARWWAEQLGALGPGMAPYLAGALTGGAAGIVGAAMGGGTVAGFQTLGSEYAAARQQGATHDDAVNHAIQAGVASGAINAAALPAATWAPFRSAVSQSLGGATKAAMASGLRNQATRQAARRFAVAKGADAMTQAGVQAGIGMGDQFAQNVLTRRNVNPNQPLTEGLLEAATGEILGEGPATAYVAGQATAGKAQDAIQSRKAQAPQPNVDFDAPPAAEGRETPAYQRAGLTEEQLAQAGFVRMDVSGQDQLALPKPSREFLLGEGATERLVPTDQPGVYWDREAREFLAQVSRGQGDTRPGAARYVPVADKPGTYLDQRTGDFVVEVPGEGQAMPTFRPASEVEVDRSWVYTPNEQAAQAEPEGMARQGQPRPEDLLPPPPADRGVVAGRGPLFAQDADTLAAMSDDDVRQLAENSGVVMSDTQLSEMHPTDLRTLLIDMGAGTYEQMKTWRKKRLVREYKALHEDPTHLRKMILEQKGQPQDQYTGEVDVNRVRTAPTGVDAEPQRNVQVEDGTGQEQDVPVRVTPPTRVRTTKEEWTQYPRVNVRRGETRQQEQAQEAPTATPEAPQAEAAAVEIPQQERQSWLERTEAEIKDGLRRGAIGPDEAREMILRAREEARMLDGGEPPSAETRPFAGVTFEETYTKVTGKPYPRRGVFDMTTQEYVDTWREHAIAKARSVRPPPLERFTAEAGTEADLDAAGYQARGVLDAELERAPASEPVDGVADRDDQGAVEEGDTEEASRTPRAAPNYRRYWEAQTGREWSSRTEEDLVKDVDLRQKWRQETAGELQRYLDEMVGKFREDETIPEAEVQQRAASAALRAAYDDGKIDEGLYRVASRIVDEHPIFADDMGAVIEISDTISEASDAIRARNGITDNEAVVGLATEVVEDDLIRPVIKLYLRKDRNGKYGGADAETLTHELSHVYARLKFQPVIQGKENPFYDRAAAKAWNRHHLRTWEGWVKTAGKSEAYIKAEQEHIEQHGRPTFAALDEHFADAASGWMWADDRVVPNSRIGEIFQDNASGTKYVREAIERSLGVEYDPEATKMFEDALTGESLAPVEQDGQAEQVADPTEDTGESAELRDMRLHHYSQQPRPLLDPDYQGTGQASGQEKYRGGPGKTYYYIAAEEGTPTGYTPEDMVTRHPARFRLDAERAFDVIDMANTEDPVMQRFRALPEVQARDPYNSALPNLRGPELRDFFESKLKEWGVDGYTDSRDPRRIFVSFQPVTTQDTEWTDMLGNPDMRRGSFQTRRAGEHRRTQGGERPGYYVGSPGITKPRQITELRNRVEMFLTEGTPGRFWYEESSQAVLDAFNGDKKMAEKFIQVLAIYSPGATVPANTTMALRAWSQWRSGEAIDAGYTALDEKAHKLLYEGENWEGRKTNSFYLNLMSEIDRSLTRELIGSLTDKQLAAAGLKRSGAVTVDLWIARAFGYPTDKVSTTAKGLDDQYSFVERELVRLADKLGWTPHQVQAAVWVGIKSRWEEVAPKVKRLAVRRKIAHWEKGAKGAKLFVLHEGQEGALRKLHMKHAFSRDANPQNIAGSAKHFGDFLGERLAQVGWEMTPSPDANWLPELVDAPLEDRLEYFERASRALYDDDGVDIVAREIGLPYYGMFQGFGGWEGSVNPSGQTLVAPLKGKGAKANQIVDPPTQQKLEAYLNAMGYLLKQDAVVWHVPVPAKRMDKANGVLMDFGRPLTAEETKIIYDLVSGRTGTSGVAPSPGPEGLRFLNFEIDNESFHDTMEEVARVAPLDDVERVKLGYFVADEKSSGYIDNDWKENPNGEAYRRRVTTALGSPDLLSRIEGIVRPRLEAVARDFAEARGWRFDPGGEASGPREDVGGEDRGGSPREEVQRELGDADEGTAEEAAQTRPIDEVYTQTREKLVPRLIDWITKGAARKLKESFKPRDLLDWQAGNLDLVTHHAITQYDNDRDRIAAALGYSKSFAALRPERALKVEAADAAMLYAQAMAHAESKGLDPLSEAQKAIDALEAASVGAPRRQRLANQDIINQIRKGIEVYQGNDPALGSLWRKIDADIREQSELAHTAGLIPNYHEVYDPRFWEDPDTGRVRGGTLDRFVTQTGRARARTFETIFDGIEQGYRLKVRGLSAANAAVKQELGTVAVNRQFVRQGRSATLDGTQLLSTNPATVRQNGYKKIDVPGLWDWEHVRTINLGSAMEASEYIGDWGYAEGVPQSMDYLAQVDVDTHDRLQQLLSGEIRDYQSQDLYIAYEPGKVEVFKKSDLYAPGEFAQFINRVYTPGYFDVDEHSSPLRRGAGKALKALYAGKRLLFTGGFFHHQALAMSWYLGVRKRASQEYGASLGETLNPMQASRAGQEAIQTLAPMVSLGVQAGLTLKTVPEWDESMFTGGKRLTNAGKARKLNRLMKMQSEWLFHQFQSGLKAKAFAIEYMHELKKKTDQLGRSPTEEESFEVAKQVAAVLNADFGGLNWRRIGRSKTARQMASLVLLAPDWTESNLRYVPFVESIWNRASGEGVLMPKQMNGHYAKFIGHAWAYGAASSLLANVASAMLGGDDLDEAWEKTLGDFGRAFEPAEDARGIYDTVRSAMRGVRETPAALVDVTPVYEKLGIDYGDADWVGWKLMKQFEDPLKLIVDFERFWSGKAGIATSAAYEFLTRSNWQGIPYLGAEDMARYPGKITKPHKYHPTEDPINAAPAWALDQALGILPIPVQNASKWALGEVDGLTAALIGSGVAIHPRFEPRPKRRRHLRYRE